MRELYAYVANESTQRIISFLQLFPIFENLEENETRKCQSIIRKRHKY